VVLSIRRKSSRDIPRYQTTDVQRRASIEESSSVATRDPGPTPSRPCRLTLYTILEQVSRVYPGPSSPSRLLISCSGPPWSHSGPSRSFRSILVTFRSIPVIQVHPGHIRVRPGHSGPPWPHSAPFGHPSPPGLNSGHSGPLGRSGSFDLIFIRSDPSGLNPDHSGSIRSKFRSFGSFRSKSRSLRTHSGLSRSFRSILVHAFGSIPVIKVYPGSCILVHPGHSGLSWFMHSGPSRSFRSILVHAFGFIPVIQVYPVHAFGSIPVVQVYPGSSIRVYPDHI
ncbi:hypothetical protein CRG98_050193, partial [Punica granatum]